MNASVVESSRDSFSDSSRFYVSRLPSSWFTMPNAGALLRAEVFLTSGRIVSVAAFIRSASVGSFIFLTPLKNI